MDSKHTTIELAAAVYADCDDCLQAAAEDAAETYGLEGYELDARWADENRDVILVTVPTWAVSE